MPIRLRAPRGRGKRGAIALAAFLPFAFACASAARTGAAPAWPPAPLPETSAPLDTEAAAWVEATLGSLDLRARVAQLVMVWMSGGYASATDAEQIRVAGLVRDAGIGGVVISLGTPMDYGARLNELQALAGVPLLVAADFEAGPGYRLGGVYALPLVYPLGGATELPRTMALGAADDAGLAYEAGRVTALEARALGVHLNFAPVLDVNNNPENPIINTRSFGERPGRVAELGAAYIRGARAGGLMTTAKHFPGHGDTGTDSHVGLPVIPGDRTRLDAIELVPFVRAIDEGVDAIMTAHVSAPAILGPDAPPATLSPYFMTRLLRDELGFDGVLFTDALDMGAITEGYGAGEAAVRALEAGADILLMPTDPALAIDAVVRAVAEGRLTEARIEASVRRLLRMKTRAGLHLERSVDPGRIREVVGVAAHTALADSIARRSLTLVRDLSGAFPVDTAAGTALFSLTFAGDADLAAGRAFDARLRGAAGVRAARAGPSTPPARWDSLAARAGPADLVVVSAYASPGGEGRRNGLAGFLAAVEAAGTPAVLVSFGSPYLLESLPSAHTYLVAWGPAEASQRAAADAVLGRIGTPGRLPISLPPYYATGYGLDRAAATAPGPDGPGVADAAGIERPAGTLGMDPAALERLDRILETATADGLVPGAALAVGRSGGVVRLRGYGRLDLDPESAPVTPSTLYDLASLTKVVGTTTAAMRLVDQGRLALDDRVGDYLPEWSAGWLGEVTIRHLLTHTAGLPPFRPFWRDHEGREAYRAAIAALEPGSPIGTETLYSDIGLMALGFVIEQIAGRGLDEELADGVFGPLGMDDTGFRPDRSLLPRIAPTEVDTLFRHRHVTGEVHDENAFALGGVAGHAGLFSTAEDLARFAGWMLRAARAGAGTPPPAGAAAPAGLPRPETVRAFTRRAGPESSRALGWDTPSGLSSSGRFTTASAFGHTGFTGTSIWIDPELDIFVVLLTNRVNPTRANAMHTPLRRAVHDAALAAIADRPVVPRPEEPEP